MLSADWNETSSKYIKWLPSVAGPDRPHSAQEDKQEEKHGVSVTVSQLQYFIQSVDFYKIAVNEREGGNTGNISTFTANYSKGEPGTG